MTTDPGLCANCCHARMVGGARSVFWMCEAAKIHDNLRRYPVLPVRDCPVYTPPATVTAETSKHE